MRVLTITEERQVLRMLQGARFIDNGASRLIYECPEQVGEMLNIDACDYIIKVGMGVGGFNQIAAEVQFALNKAYAPVAEIRAYGRFIEVMERVEIEADFRDFACDIYVEDADDVDYVHRVADNYNMDYDVAEEAAAVIAVLHDYFGHTSDNGQLGRNRNGDLVAYDFGFDTGDCRDDQVSSLDEMLECDKELRDKYLEGLIDIIGQDIEAIDRYERLFYERVDNADDPSTKRYSFKRYIVYGLRSDNRFVKDITKYEPDDWYKEWFKCYRIIKREYVTEGFQSEAELIREDILEESENMTEEQRQILDENIEDDRN